MRLQSLLLTCAMAAGLLAAAPLRAAEFRTSTDGRCTVWGPWSLGDAAQQVRYEGGCVKGKADGAGKAEWLSPYRKGDVDETWQGSFRQGVFIGDQGFKGSLDGWRSNVVLSDRGALGDARVVWVHPAPSKGPVKLCDIERAAVIVKPGFKLEDDEAVQALMKRAQEAAVSACPSNAAFRSVEVVLWRAPLVADDKGEQPAALARGGVVVDKGTPAEVRAYRNDTSSELRQKQQSAERAARREAVRQAFHRFSASQQVSAWLTAEQADRDPFKWQGKKVGMLLRLERMLSPTVAWAVDADRNAYGRSLLLTGINSDTFGKLGLAVVAGQLHGRKKPSDLGVGSGNEYPDASVLNVSHSQACEQRQCADWLGWDYSKDMTWGEPFKAAP